MDTKQHRKKLQVIKINEDNENTPALSIILPRRKRMRARDVLRIQSQLIRGFIDGKIESQKAKDLSYLCSNYLNNIQVVEYEERIEQLEKKQARLSNEKL